LWQLRGISTWRLCGTAVTNLKKIYGGNKMALSKKQELEIEIRIQDSNLQNELQQASKYRASIGYVPASHQRMIDDTSAKLRKARLEYNSNSR
jgi:hypothetical protein